MQTPSPTPSMQKISYHNHECVHSAGLNVASIHDKESKIMGAAGEGNGDVGCRNCTELCCEGTVTEKIENWTEIDEILSKSRSNSY